ncbi:MAG: 2-hydroxyacyl-CoA dehydratase [Dehalococcoidia bacterium]|nr:MAG: 2-hydroxyacyl-CoA dehydratase [Dehalococcoidia bacterium]
MNNKAKDNLLHSLNIKLAERPQKIAVARESGNKLVGYFCPYGTEEMILAANLIPIRLAFGGDSESISAGEAFLKGHSCPYACSSIGNKKLSINDYYNSLDGVCIAQTYDSMKILGDYYQNYFKLPVFPLGLPRTHNALRSKSHAFDYFKNELKLLQTRLGGFSGKTATDFKMHQAINLCNRIRDKLLFLYKLPQDRNTPIEWRQILKITQAGFLLDRADYLKELEGIEKALRNKSSDKGLDDKRSRLMIVGSLIGIGDEKILDIIEQTGGNIVADCVCTGSMFLRKKVPTFGILSAPIDGLTERYLYNVPCPFMIDKSRRLSRIVKTAKDYRVHGMVYYNLRSNETWRSEFKAIKDVLYRNLSIPTLLIETDYSSEDKEEITEKVKSFLKLVGG